METTINQRIRQIIDYFDLSVFRFSKSIETAQPTIKSIVDDKTKPSYDTIYKILKKYPINAAWLVMGDGEMLKKYKEKAINNENESMIDTIQIMKYKLSEIEKLIAASSDEEYKK